MRRKLRGNGDGEEGGGDVPAAAVPRFAKISDELLDRLHSMRGGIAAAHHHHISEEEKLVMPSNSTTSGIEASLRENLGHHDNATDDESLPKDPREGVRVLKKGKKKMVQYGKSEEMEKHQHVWKLAEKEKEEEEVKESNLHHPGRTRKDEKKEEATTAAAAAIANDRFAGDKDHMVVSTSSPTSSHFSALHLLKPELVGEAYEYSMKWSTVLREEDAADDKEEEKEDQHHVKEKEHRVEEKGGKEEHHHHVEEEGEKEKKEEPHYRPHPLRPLGDEEGEEEKEEKEKELHLHEVEKEEEQDHQPHHPPSSPHHPHEVEGGEKEKEEPHHRPHPHKVEEGEQEKEPHHSPHPPAHRQLGAATHHRHPYDGEEEEGEEGEEFERYYTRDNGQWNRLHHHRSPSSPPRHLLNEQVAAMSRLLNMTAEETAHLQTAAREAAMDMIREEEAKVSRRNNNKEATAASPSASSSPDMDLTAVLKALAVTKPSLDGSSSTHR